MKRLFVLGLTAAGCAALAAAALAGPSFDKAEGSATMPKEPCCQARQFSFSAADHGFSDRATGQYVQNWGGTFVGDITCLRVDGNRAIFAGITKQVPPNSPLSGREGEPFIVSVVDNGPPGSDPPDEASPLFVFGGGSGPPVPHGFPNVCPDLPAWPAEEPIASGDIVVTDESAGG